MRLMTASDILQGARRAAGTAAGSLKTAVAGAVTLLADLEADCDLRRRLRLDIRSSARGRHFNAAKNRVTSVLAKADDKEISVIVKRPPVRIFQAKSQPGLLTEARVLGAVSGCSSIGVSMPTVLGVGYGRFLKGSVLVMDKLPGEVVSSPDWYQDRILETLADAYSRVHSTFSLTVPQLAGGHAVMQLTSCLFESLPPSIKADVQASGGMPSGLVHGDPHPGNWLWAKTGLSVSLVDWGDAHVGWPSVEIARCGMFIAERAGEEAGLYFLEQYFGRRPRLSAGVFVAGHMIAQRWPRGDDEALARYAQIDEAALRGRREAYFRVVLDSVR